MGTLFVTNAFSLNMLKNVEAISNINVTNYEFIAAAAATLTFAPISRNVVEDLIRCFSGSIENVIGHKDTADLIDQMFPGMLPPAERRSVSIDFRANGDRALVFQYTGPRLPEGATSLPEGAMLQAWLVVPDYHRD